MGKQILGGLFQQDEGEEGYEGPYPPPPLNQTPTKEEDPTEEATREMLRLVGHKSRTGYVRLPSSRNNFGSTAIATSIKLHQLQFHRRNFGSTEEPVVQPQQLRLNRNNCG